MHSKRLQTVMLMLAVTSICVMILALLLYSSAAEALKQEITNAYHVSLLNTRDRMETYLRHLDQSALQFEKVPGVVRLIEEGREESMTGIDIMAIQTVMMRIHASLEYVDNVAVYDIRSGTLWATNIQMNEVCGNYREVFDTFVTTNEKRAFLHIDIGGRPVILYIRKMPAFSRLQPVCILYHINQRIFDDFLGEERYSDTGSFFIMDGMGAVIAYRGPASQDDVDRWTDHIRTEMSRVPEPGIGSFASGRSFVMCLPESFDGWVYAFGISNDVFLYRLYTLRNVTVMVSLALLASSIIISVFSSGWLWRGWKKIRTLVEDDVGLPPGKSNEFDAVFSKVMNVVEQSKELRTRMEEILPAMRESTMLSFLENGFRTPEDWSKASELGIPVHPGLFGCLYLEPDRTWEAGTYSERDISILEYAVLSVVREVFEQDRNGFAVRLDNGSFAAMLSSDGTVPAIFMRAVVAAAERIRAFIEQYFPFTVSIGVSGVRSDFRYTNVACREARENMLNKHIAGGNRVFYPAPDGGRPANERFPIREIENDILYGIRSRNRACAEAALSRLGEIKQNPDIQYMWLQGKLVETAQSIFRQVNRILDEPVPEPALNELLEQVTIENWTEWFRASCIDPLMKRFESRHRTESEQIVMRVTEYIRSRIETHIRLEECSAELKIPVSSVKQALREVLSTTFAELVLSERIDRAKELLRNDSMSVVAIAHRLCYSNAQNFSRTFKKAVGISPGYYRMKGS
jgi:two-component system response regulator YesN